MADRPWDLNIGNLPVEWIGHCNECHAPIVGYGWWRRLFHAACFRLLMAIPDRWMPWAILPYAGNHAYTCNCKNRAAAAAVHRRYTYVQRLNRAQSIRKKGGENGPEG